MKILIAVLASSCLFNLATAEVSVIAATLGVEFKVVSNSEDGKNFSAQVILTNQGSQAIPQSDWELYYMSIYMLQPKQELWKDPTAGYVIPGSRFRVFHINGCLFKFVPTSEFNGIQPGGSYVIDLTVQNWSVSRTDNMPNWYVVDTKTGEVAIISSTATEQLKSFTGPYNTSDQWKRSAADQYDPWTLEERGSQNDVDDLGAAQILVIPTPSKVEMNPDSIRLPLSSWVVYTTGNDLKNESNLLREKLSLDGTSSEPTDKYISLMLDPSGPTNDGYKLIIDGDNDNRSSISITSKTASGVYYGCQTLISIVDGATDKISSVTIEDAPRYGYRGMHVDVARHFVPYEDMVKLIKAMGMYKLNKLHFHLTDDEGWRIEMPWCPYLTTVGATQCHDPNEESCIYPQFGSKADGSGRGSGFYTREEYRNLLRLAETHHIEVIPEIDLPGHSRAAIKATEAYLKAAKPGSAEETNAKSIQLSEPSDTSLYLSVQMYTDSAINPCLDSTYEFIRKMLESLLEYHRDIQPLKTIHLGGDEVPAGTWSNSKACKDVINDKTTNVNSVKGLGEYFVQRASELVKNVDSNLVLGLWEDGAITDEEVPFSLDKIATDEVLVNAWQNIWEWGVGDRAYKLANAGYKVVMSQATHLYFDHPQEPDPEERGFYWATRFTNTRKTFQFTPDDLYANIDTNRNGEPITEEEACNGTCLPLQKPENIIGMQGQIWGETMRASSHFFEAVFPRLLALAERAWHKAAWEDMTEDDWKVQRSNDWKNFANTLGYKEFRRLDAMGIPYRVPVVGAEFVNDKIRLISEFPGLEMLYSTSEDPTKWMKYTHPLPTTVDTYLQVRSSDGARGGRVVASISLSKSLPVKSNIFLVMFCLLFIFCVF